MSGVSINTLYGITKRDNITIKNEILTPIADVLGVPPQYILGLDGEALIWTDDDIRLFRDDDFIDSKDGLLGEIIKIFNNLTLEGKLKCLEFSKDLEKKYLNTDKQHYNEMFKEYNKLRLNEIVLLHDKKEISDIDFQKLTLMYTKNLFLPFPYDDDEEGEIFKNDKRIHQYIHEINEIIKSKVLLKEIEVSPLLYDWITQ